MTHVNVSRREFLKTGTAAGASLLIGFHFPPPPATPPPPSPSPTVPFKPNAWLEISPDGSVTIWTGRSGMGEGGGPPIPMIVAAGGGAAWGGVGGVEGG